jgi:hypothetical protein
LNPTIIRSNAQEFWKRIKEIFHLEEISTQYHADTAHWYNRTVLIVMLPVTFRKRKVVDCNLSSYIIAMACQPQAGRGGRGGSGRGGCGGRFHKRNEPGSLACKSGEVGACKDLEQNVFTIGSGNKGKDSDLLRTSKEKLASYIGTNYGDDACQEWQFEKQLVLQEPTYPEAVLARHAVWEKAVTDRVTKMVTSLEKQLVVIKTKLLLTPRDLNLLKSQMEVESKLDIAKFELTDVVEVKTTSDEGMAFSNLWQTYRERTDRLVRSRGKVYSLVLGQCTTVLLDKMKQDAGWQGGSDSYNRLQLLQLIDKITLKQSDNQYKIAIIMEQLKLLLAYRQDDGVTNAAYYD